jgi:hypothetical protein
VLRPRCRPPATTVLAQGAPPSGTYCVEHLKREDGVAVELVDLLVTSGVAVGGGAAGAGITHWLQLHRERTARAAAAEVRRLDYQREVLEQVQELVAPFTLPSARPLSFEADVYGFPHRTSIAAAVPEGFAKAFQDSVPRLKLLLMRVVNQDVRASMANLISSIESLDDDHSHYVEWGEALWSAVEAADEVVILAGAKIARM